VKQILIYYTILNQFEDSVLPLGDPIELNLYTKIKSRILKDKTINTVK